MFKRITKNLCLPALHLSGAMLPGAFVMSGMITASAQPPAPVAAANFDPSDVYFQGYLATKAAEKQETDGDFVGAADNLKKARELFAAVDRYYPNWKPEVVKGRIERNEEFELRVHPKAEEQRRHNRSAVAELEGGQRNPGTLAPSGENGLPPESTILDADPLATRRLAEAEAEVRRLQNLLRNPSSADPSRDASRVGDLARQRDALQAQLNAADKNAQQLRARLAASPMENQLRSLNLKISGLEQERSAMGLALKQSRTQHLEALARIATLETDLKITQQKSADLKRDLELVQDTSDQLVEGLNKQLREQQKKMAEKDIELAKANEAIGSLSRQLEEAGASFGQLREERDSLLTERDQMRALLNLNEPGRIRELVEQNVGLSKSLREASEQVEMLSRDGNATKDQLNSALRDVGMAKTKIIVLQDQKRDQDNRLAEYEKRLKVEESALARGEASSDPAEVKMLRDIIQRQLRAQNLSRQARELLVDAVKTMAKTDERIAQALKLFDSQEVQLTPEEQRLVADKEVDGVFISPVILDRSIVGRNTDELNREIAVFERTAEKSFAAGRYLPTRELFQLIIEQHPGHIPALCKLGVVELKLDNPSAAVDDFRRAVELDSANAYAHRMLGYSLFVQGDYTAAEQSVKEAVKLAADDALGLSLLGSICEYLKRNGEAETYYKAAITADPMLWKPYFNISRLAAKDKRLDTAREYYQQALEHGAIPDPELEKRIRP